MELQEFIKTAIVSISNGIIDAQAELKDKNVIVNPEKVELNGGEKALRTTGYRYTQNLDFEVLISVEENNKTEGGGKLKVMNVASIGLEKSNVNSAISSNKLKFSIPVAFPTTETPEKYKPGQTIF